MFERSTIKNSFLAGICYNSVLDCSFGIHTDLTDGIPSYRIVYLNTQAKDVNETLTDNGTVGYAATADATAVVAGVVKDGCTVTNEFLIPGINKDYNVTVTVLGTMIVEVAAGEVITPGLDLGADAEGRATALGGTGIIALSGADGTGTADRPQYVTALVR